MSQRQVHDTPVLLTVVEVAQILRVSRRTVERYVAAGRLPAVTLPSGRGLRFRPEDVERIASAA